MFTEQRGRVLPELPEIRKQLWVRKIIDPSLACAAGVTNSHVDAVIEGLEDPTQALLDALLSEEPHASLAT